MDNPLMYKLTYTVNYTGIIYQITEYYFTEQKAINRYKELSNYSNNWKIRKPHYYKIKINFNKIIKAILKVKEAEKLC